LPLKTWKAQASVPVVCRCMKQFNSQILGVLDLSGTCFPPKLPFPRGSSPLRNMFLGSSPLIIPNGISIDSTVFVGVPNAMLYNALSVGKKTPKLPLSLGISSPCWRRSHGHRHHAQKLAKIARVVREISSRTDTHTQTCSSQYFATANGCEVL